MGQIIEYLSKIVKYCQNAPLFHSQNYKFFRNNNLYLRSFEDDGGRSLAEVVIELAAQLLSQHIDNG